ncbi:MAG: TetR/AcrR family transcriptional regulator [Bacteroidota bacterium]
MVSGTKHLSSAQREQQIINAADIILTQVGVQVFTIDRVIEFLGIAKGTVYKYFDSKDDLLAEVSVKALSMLLNYFRLSQNESVRGTDRTRAILSACYSFGQDYPQYIELLFYMERPEFSTGATNYITMSEKITDFVKRHIELEIENGNLRKNLDPNYTSHVMWGSCMGVMQFLDAKKNFLENVGTLTQKQLVETYIDIMVAGMAA